MPDIDDKFTDISKIMYQSAEEAKADAVTKIFKENIEQLKTSFENTYQEKLEEKIKEIKKDLIEKYEKRCEEIENKNNKIHTKHWVIITGLFIALLNVCAWAATWYIGNTNNKFKDYQDFCEKIVDEKIKNITLKK